MARYRRERPKKLGAKMRQIRLWMDMTQEELAEKLGTDSGAISRFERGEREPSLLEILAFSQWTGVGLELLIDDKLSLPKKRQSTRL
jgi:transcriptional regulator with XRE-family HTH domain